MLSRGVMEDCEGIYNRRVYTLTVIQSMYWWPVKVWCMTARSLLRHKESIFLELYFFPGKKTIVPCMHIYVCVYPLCRHTIIVPPSVGCFKVALHAQCPYQEALEENWITCPYLSHCKQYSALTFTQVLHTPNFHLEIFRPAKGLNTKTSCVCQRQQLI